MPGAGLRPRLESIALLIALTACSPASKEAPVDDSSATVASVVLISIDTLRSDHLPIYGYTEVATPAIDRLAGDGIVYERAFAHAPLTLPSHVSMFSGVLPSRHGVRDNLGYRVPASLLWLPERLRQRGYRTGAFVSSAVLDPSTGMDRGFDRYDDGSGSGEDPGVRSGPDTVAAALGWLEDLPARGTEPIFLFVHLYEPHQPYRPEPPFDVYDSPYDGEIATADAAVGTLLDGLEERGLYDGSLIVLTSDHGEGLGEHGERDHGVFVYRESLQVPLIVKLPGGRSGGQRVSSPVQHADLLPTVLDALGEPGDIVEPDPDSPGLSLLRGDLLAEHAERFVYAESYVPRLYYGASELHTLIGPRLQYIDSPKPELFDLLADPAGLDNLVDRNPEAVDSYRRRLEPFVGTLEAADPVADAQRRKLEQLGYLGGAAPPTQVDLPAPSDHIELLDVVSQAYDALADDRFEEARRGFRRAIELNPLAAFAWAQLSRAEAALGREQEALDAALKSLELTEDAPHRLLPTARLALKLGRLDEAEALAARAEQWSAAESLALRCRVAVRRGDLETARDLALSTLDVEASRSAPALQVLSALLREGRAQDTLTFGASIEARIDETPFGLNLVLGQALARIGRHEEAVNRLEREVRLFPDRPRAYGHLAVLYGHLDRPEEAGGTIDRLLASSAGPARYVTAIQALAQLGFPDEAVALLQQALSEHPSDPDLRRLAQAARATP